MITCRTFVEFLMDYLDGLLPPHQRDEFESHLSQCSACVAYMNSYRQTVHLGREAFKDLDASLPDDVPEELVRAVMAARRQRS